MFNLLDPGGTGLPQIIEWILTAAGLVLGGVLYRVQTRRGRAAPPQEVRAELAGAVISNAKADEVVAGLAANARATAANARAARSLVKDITNLTFELKRNTEVTGRNFDQMDELRSDLKALTREIIARGRD